MDRNRFSTHKRPAFLLAGVLLVLLGLLGAWHVLSRQAQWTGLDQAALENAGDAHLRSLSQQAEQCAGAHDFLWTGEPVELTNRLSSEAHAFLPVCAISPADVPKYGDAAWEIEFFLLTTWDGDEPPAWVPKLSVSQWELELDPGINTGLTGPDWHSAGGARWYSLTQADASLWQEAQNGTPEIRYSLQAAALDSDGPDNAPASGTLSLSFTLEGGGQAQSYQCRLPCDYLSSAV